MSEQKNIDGGWTFVGVFFLILLIIFLSWVSTEHVYVWYYLKLPLVKLFYYIPETIKPYLFFWIEYFDYFKVNDINLFFNNLNLIFEKGVHHVYKLSYDGEINPTAISTIISYMYLPFIIPFLFYYSLKSLSSRSFVGNFDMSSFRNQESELWPTIKPALSVSEKSINDLSDPEWSMSIRPENFFWNESRNIKFFDFFDSVNDKYNLNKKDKSFLDLEKKDVKFKIKEEEFRKFFLEQLGEPWTGADNLTEEELNILCIFITKADRQTDLSLKYVRLCSNYYNSLKGLKNRKIRKQSKKEIQELRKKILSEYLEKPNIQKIINSYYYKYTVFAGLLESAREDGVLANSDFIWLKPKNRTLWYILSSVGRNLPFADAAGIWSHFNYEKRVGFSLNIPKIEKAVESIDIYFNDRYNNYISLNPENNDNEDDEDDD